MRVETFGIKGPDCMRYAEMMEKIVGMLEQKKTQAEFYETPPAVRIHVAQRRTLSAVTGRGSRRRVDCEGP